MGNVLSKTALLITASFGSGESATVDVDCDPHIETTVYCCQALDNRFNPYGSTAKDGRNRALFWGCVNEGTISNKMTTYNRDPGVYGHFWRLSAPNLAWDGVCGYGFVRVDDSICEASKNNILVHGSATDFYVPERDMEEYNNQQQAGEDERPRCPSCLQKANGVNHLCIVRDVCKISSGPH